MADLYIVVVNRTDRRLGRQVVHDPRSRRFAAPVKVDRSRWVSRINTIYDPFPNPNQQLGDCTGCQKAMAFNTFGQRKPGVRLGLDFADRVYSLATQLDPWDGSWPPDDTGSSALAAAKAAQQLGIGGEYRWYFGIDEVVQGIIDRKVIGLGTWWYEAMFNPRRVHGRDVIEPGGSRAGGHEYTARGYDVSTDMVLIRCWWGDFRDVWIRREQLGELLADDGDAQSQIHA